MSKKIKILIAKVGLDGHDRGAKVVARALIEAGFDVVYTGLRKTPKQIALIAEKEKVDFVGLSLLSGAHRELFPYVVDELKNIKMHHVKVFGGGIIPKSDFSFLKNKGIEFVFTTGTFTSSIIEYINKGAVCDKSD